MDAEELAGKMADSFGYDVSANRLMGVIEVRFSPKPMAMLPYARALIEAEKALAAADSIMWMASEYADAGGPGGPEMREYRPAAAEVTAALASLRSLLEKAK